MNTQREIFGIMGLPPEVLAVAMAKYSRSKESIKVTIDDLTEEKSAKFHEKWVLGYGDASVADMALIAIALENVSILASKAIQDNRLASYQEKSTRYVGFEPDRVFQPANLLKSAYGPLYQETMRTLFGAYEQVLGLMKGLYMRMHPKTSEMTDALYEARITARSLDVARYLLPPATLTNFGMIMSARSLRHCISKLKASPLPEIREIGAEIQKAAVEYSYHPRAAKANDLLAQLLNHQDAKVKAIAAAIKQVVALNIKGAPTLVKHTEPKEYLVKKSAVLSKLASKYLTKVKLAKSEPRVDFMAEYLDPEIELVATLLYGASKLSFRQIVKCVLGLKSSQRQEIIENVQAERGPHDWPSREFEVGQGFIFDLLMDYGSFRDLQRHRLTTQINQALTIDHGFEYPRDLKEAGGQAIFEKGVAASQKAYRKIVKDFPHEARYVVAMGFRKRTLFKMNLRELFHILELRSKPGGHFSYRDICWQMYEQFKSRHSVLAQSFRIKKMDYHNEFFMR